MSLFAVTKKDILKTLYVRNSKDYFFLQLAAIPGPIALRHYFSIVLPMSI